MQKISFVCVFLISAVLSNLFIYYIVDLSLSLLTKTYKWYIIIMIYWRIMS